MVLKMIPMQQQQQQQQLQQQMLMAQQQQPIQPNQQQQQQQQMLIMQHQAGGAPMGQQMGMQMQPQPQQQQQNIAVEEAPSSIFNPNQLTMLKTQIHSYKFIMRNETVPPKVLDILKTKPSIGLPPQQQAPVQNGIQQQQMPPQQQQQQQIRMRKSKGLINDFSCCVY